MRQNLQPQSGEPFVRVDDLDALHRHLRVCLESSVPVGAEIGLLTPPLA